MASHVKIFNPDGTEVCTVCGGKDDGKKNEIPCECPERQLSEDEKKKIIARELDFSEGRWRTYAKIF